MKKILLSALLALSLNALGSEGTSKTMPEFYSDLGSDATVRAYRNGEISDKELEEFIRSAAPYLIDQLEPGLSKSAGQDEIDQFADSILNELKESSKSERSAAMSKRHKDMLKTHKERKKEMGEFFSDLASDATVRAYRNGEISDKGLKEFIRSAAPDLIDQLEPGRSKSAGQDEIDQFADSILDELKESSKSERFAAALKRHKQMENLAADESV